nr:lipid droplet-associated hydrolase [Pogona vitticeps]
MLLAGDEAPTGEGMSKKKESEEQVVVHEEFTYVNGAATQILKCGPWRDLWKYENTPKVLFLVIPGNPGLADFYRTFIRTLYCSLKQQYPVWAVSHAGHCKVPNGMKMTEETENSNIDDVFGLRGQIEHKLSFLRKNVPKDVKLVLIGHSIGSYISLQIMELAPELEILHSVHLFPTIERMAQSPQGKILTPLVCYLRYIVYIPVYLMTLLPERVKSPIVRFVMGGRCSEELLTTVMDMLNMDCLANVFYMASQEMRMVTKRDSSTIRKHLKKLTFYYGAKDLWCPRQYYEEMKMEFPEGDIQLCERGFHHAFILRSSKEVAEMVTHWVLDDLDRL